MKKAMRNELFSSCRNKLLLTRINDAAANPDKWSKMNVPLARRVFESNTVESWNSEDKKRKGSSKAETATKPEKTL